VDGYGWLPGQRGGVVGYSTTVDGHACSVLLNLGLTWR